MELINKQLIPYLICIFVVCSSLLTFSLYIKSTKVYAQTILDTNNTITFEMIELNELIGVDKKPYIENDIIRMIQGDYSEFDYVSLIAAKKYDGTPIDDSFVVCINTISNQPYTILYYKVSDDEGYCAILKVVVILEGVESDTKIYTYEQGVFT